MSHLIPCPDESLLHNGSACASLAVTAYNRELARLGDWTQVRWFRNGNATGFVGWSVEHGVSFIAIAGTNDRLDAVNDMSCRKVPLRIAGTSRTIQVHEGFLHYAELAYNGIKLLRQMTHLTGRKLFIAGHSLGGAAAEILPLLDEDIDPIQIHTFGAPRWCDSADALDYPYCSTHWRRPEDIVPDVPLNLTQVRLLARVGGFSHVRGQSVWLTPEKADSETLHVLRRIQRIGRYGKASLRGFLSAWRNGWRPVHTTCRIIEALNQQAAADHLDREYLRLIEQHRVARLGGEG